MFCVCVLTQTETILFRQLSMDTEDQKMRAKKRSLTLKAFKLLKGKANAKICLPEAAALVASMMGNSGRHPHKDAPIEERRAICDWCVDTIHRHICLINSMCQVRLVLCHVEFQSF